MQYGLLSDATGLDVIKTLPDLSVWKFADFQQQTVIMLPQWSLQLYSYQLSVQVHALYAWKAQCYEVVTSVNKSLKCRIVFSPVTDSFPTYHHCWCPETACKFPSMLGTCWMWGGRRARPTSDHQTPWNTHLRKTQHDEWHKVLAWLWNYFMTFTARYWGFYTGVWHNNWLDPCTDGLSPLCPGDRNVIQDSVRHSVGLRFNIICWKGKKCVNKCELWAPSPGSCIIWKQLHGSFSPNYSCELSAAFQH